MATEKWIAGSGVGLTWTALFGTEINSLPNGDAILGSVAVANGTALDMFMDVSFALASVTTVGTPVLGLFLYPLNEDGSTYGDGRFGSAAAGPPPGNYLSGQAGLPVGTQALTGLFRGFMSGPLIIPPGTFSAVLFNGAGVALASSGNAIKYRTYNRQVA
jgi:hypothetical protein